MTNFEITQVVLQTSGSVGLFLTLYIYYRQLKTMSHQLEASRNASTAQNIVALINFLQTAEVRASREILRTKIKDKPYPEWTPDDRSHISRVCANYDIAAVLLRMGMVPKEPFVENWGHSIRHCHDVAK